MSKETRVVLGVLLSVVFLGLKIASRSSRHSSYPDLSTYSQRSYPPLTPYVSPREMARNEERQLREEAEQLLDSTFAEGCTTDPSSELYLEVQAQSPAFMDLNRSLLSQLLPEGKAYPKPVKAAGLEVLVLKRKAPIADAHPTCFDTSEALIQRIRNGLHLADAPLERVDGAVVVKTTDDTAAQMLLAPDLKTVVDAKGPVVAFVGSDNLVTLADSTNPTALRTAARRSAEGIDASAQQGCSLVEPQVLINGKWSAWTPNAALRADVEAHRRVVKACLANLVQGVLTGYRSVSAELPRGLSTGVERRYDPKLGSIAMVSLDRVVGPQVLVDAEQVELAHNDGRRTMLSWPVFQRSAKKGLTQVTLDGRRYTEAWIIDPEMVASLDVASNETLKALR